MHGGLRLQGIEKAALPEQPLVSIITVVLNGGKHLEQTIQSVLNQSYKNIEYIIIDGGSKDDTLNIIRHYEQQIDFWQSEPDGGIYFAMNKGIALAKGELIGILNADDYYMEDAVQNIIQAHQAEQADVYHGDMLSIVGSKETRMFPDASKMDEMPSIFHPTCFVAKQVYEKAGDFDTQFKLSSDYDFLLRCLRQNYRFYYVPKLMTAFRAGGMSASCYSNVEGYKIMKRHQTGYQNAVIIRGIKCYLKTFVKKILHLNQ